MAGEIDKDDTIQVDIRAATKSRRFVAELVIIPRDGDGRDHARTVVRQLGRVRALAIAGRLLELCGENRLAGQVADAREKSLAKPGTKTVSKRKRHDNLVDVAISAKGDDYKDPGTFRSDASAILESLVMDTDESKLSSLMVNQGFRWSDAYRTTFRGLVDAARKRRASG